MLLCRDMLVMIILAHAKPCNSTNQAPGMLLCGINLMFAAAVYMGASTAGSVHCQLPDQQPCDVVKPAGQRAAHMVDAGCLGAEGKVFSHSQTDSSPASGGGQSDGAACGRHVALVSAGGWPLGYYAQSLLILPLTGHHTLSPSILHLGLCLPLGTAITTYSPVSFVK